MLSLSALNACSGSKSFSGKIRLSTIPAIEAQARAERLIFVAPTLNVTPFETPSATTRITAAMIVLRAFEKSTFASTTLRTPIAEIIP